VDLSKWDYVSLNFFLDIRIPESECAAFLPDLIDDQHYSNHQPPVSEC
jgi:hypothetical protein